jgi:hypothetical protein
VEWNSRAAVIGARLVEQADCIKGISNNSSSSKGVPLGQISKFQTITKSQMLNDRKNDFLCLVFYHWDLFAICNL